MTHQPTVIGSSVVKYKFIIGLMHDRSKAIVVYTNIGKKLACNASFREFWL